MAKHNLLASVQAQVSEILWPENPGEEIPSPNANTRTVASSRARWVSAGNAL